MRHVITRSFLQVMRIVWEALPGIHKPRSHKVKD